ncbi:hypothetical protein [Candidatus Solincola tengchongensis]|uniref:hypothetical protein n=1 Tax=Candidatus Solincola tengchongensis TaxID=2900693 RepID=UPI00257A731C|nr:hypothetical protein [Candidatus Solincola tengchongensis]
MKKRSLLILGALGLGTMVLQGGGERTVSMHPYDWRGPQIGVVHREYRNLKHAFHHWKELVGLGLMTLADIYLRHAISPAFRERIMIVTATCNDCHW